MNVRNIRNIDCHGILNHGNPNYIFLIIKHKNIAIFGRLISFACDGSGADAWHSMVK